MIKTSLKEKGNEDGKKRNGVEMEINLRCGKDQSFTAKCYKDSIESCNFMFLGELCKSRK